MHVLYCASKAQLLYTAMQHGCMPHLNFSQAVEGVALWTHRHVTHHVGLTDVQQSVQDQLSIALAGLGTAATPQAQHGNPSVPPAVQHLLDEARSLTSSGQGQGQQQCWMIIDADGSQAELSPSGPSLFEAALYHLEPSRVLLLVQNIHFLPLGPYGTAACTPRLLAAWGRVAGVACVSHFVAQYVAQHAAPLGLQQQRIYVAHCAAWCALSSGPFQDYGAVHAAHLPWHATPAASHHSSSGNSSCSDPPPSGSSSQQQHQQWKPIIGCLKLTPEKGGRIFLSLAQYMPECNFLGVCSDAALQQAAAALALPNLRLVQPIADVDQLLQHMAVVLAPSLWQEAFGMVVVAAQLRGVPVIVSNQGGLAEAAQGAAAAVVPVNPMTLPVDDSGCPSWRQRVFPAEQPVDMWAAAIKQLLGSRERYHACSKAGRAAALAAVVQQAALLQQFVGWITGLG